MSKLNSSYYNEDFTLKPKINEKSQKMINEKFPDRKFVEELYENGVKK